MTLPKEWHKEAKKYSWAINDQHSYLDGATAYKQAVEAELNRRIEMCKIKVNTEPDARGSYLQQASYYEQLLTELVSLKPTSNDYTTTK
jgi:hypothetical protein